MNKRLWVKSILTAALVGIMALIPLQVSAGAEGEVTGEITVSCFDSEIYKEFLESAAKSFEARYPGTKVNIDAFSAMPNIKTITTEDDSGGTTLMQVVDNRKDPKAQSDYITRVNTEMMSGKGADIYGLDVLPYTKYADNGMFEDLRSFMDSDPEFDYDNYRKSVFDAAMYAGGQYILPLNYSFNYLGYNTTLMDSEAGKKIEFGKHTIEQLSELGMDSFLNRYDPGADSPIKLFNSSGGFYIDSFCSKLLNMNYRSFVNPETRTANFTDGRFTQILNTAKEYEEKGYINEPLTPVFMSTQSFLYKSYDQFGLLETLFLKELSLEGRMGSGSHSIGKDDELMGLLSGDNGECEFETSQAYAMSTNSKNKDTAWAFLRFLLEDETQASFGMGHGYVPVNKNAEAQKVKYSLHDLFFQYMAIGAIQRDMVGTADGNSTGVRVAEGETIASYSFFDMGEFELNEVQQKIFDTYMEYMEQYTALLNSYTIRDVIVDEMIKTEVEKFFDGSRSADEVASVLQSKVSMYLQE